MPSTCVADVIFTCAYAVVAFVESDTLMRLTTDQDPSWSTLNPVASATAILNLSAIDVAVSPRTILIA